MENFKFIIISVIVILALIVFGYWSFTSLESGADHADRQSKKELEQENKDLKDQIKDLEDELLVYQEKEQKAEEEAGKAEADVADTSLSAETQTEKGQDTGSAPNVSSQNQTLINGLQEMIDNKVVAKKGSRGTRVGVIQQFLNLYNNTSTKVDNDFGATTVTAVKNFQQAQGLPITGEVGEKTLTSMINWLQKH